MGLVLIAWAAGAASTARAQPAPGDLVAAAERAEREIALERADELYARVLETAPGSREARRARVRLQWLRERRDPEAGYGPLETLVRAQRSELGPAEAERLARSVEGLGQGRVRREALFLLGETWHRRLGRPERAIPFYRALIESEEGDESLRQMARVSLAEAQSAAGRTGEGLRELERAGLGDAFEARELRRAHLRGQLRLASIGLVAGALLVLLAAGRPWRAPRVAARRALGLRRLLAVLYVVAIPAAIAELYETGTGGTFLVFGLGVLPVLVLAALSAESLAARRAARGPRIATVLATLLAPLPIAYLVLDQAEALTSFGL